jgi:hypothetical protein
MSVLRVISISQSASITARAGGVRSDEVVPPPVARRAEVRLRPPVRLVAKDVAGRPVVVLGAVCSADLATVPGLSRFDFPRLNACSQNCLLGDEVRGSMPAGAHEEMLHGTTLVLAFHDFPRLMPTARGAWVTRPFKGCCDHENLPLLR